MQFIILVLIFSVASATPLNSVRIIGGSETTIYEYPEMVAILRGFLIYQHHCGGVILNDRAVLTAAHCIDSRINLLRVSYGSTYTDKGKVVNVRSFIHHPDYNRRTMDSDICLIFGVGKFPNTPASRPAKIAGIYYSLGDNEEVWAAGWGTTVAGDPSSGSRTLRHVKIWTVKQDTCRERYANRNVHGVHRPVEITDNMLCSGWLDVGGRDQCQGDSGGPLYHNGVVVGICSWGEGCAEAKYPGVNTRVSNFTRWIAEHA